MINGQDGGGGGGGNVSSALSSPTDSITTTSGDGGATTPIKSEYSVVTNNNSSTSNNNNLLTTTTTLTQQCLDPVENVTLTKTSKARQPPALTAAPMVTGNIPIPLTTIGTPTTICLPQQEVTIHVSRRIVS
jgi:hypothetical protein